MYSTYGKVIPGEDFNSQIGKNCIDTFMYQHNLQSIVREIIYRDFKKFIEQWLNNDLNQKINIPQ